MSKADKPIYPSEQVRYQDLQMLAAQQGPLSLEATMRAQKPPILGMTLLEHYAGLAMQGLVCSPLPEVQSAPLDIMAGWAVQTARALISELEKEAP